MSKYNLSNDDNYKTPPDLYKKLDEEFNFDYDPCPYNEDEITDENDGLLKEWGGASFINPPYSKPLKDLFVNKAIEESKKGKLCVMLIPVVTSSKLFHNAIVPNAKDIRFIKGRIKFHKMINGKFTQMGSGRHDSMIVVFDGRSPSAPVPHALRDEGEIDKI